MSSNIAIMMSMEQFLHETEENNDLEESQYARIIILKLISITSSLLKRLARVLILNYRSETEIGDIKWHAHKLIQHNSLTIRLW